MKKWRKITKVISCRLQFIDGAKCMVSSLSNLVNKLAEGIHKIKCPDTMIKKTGSCGNKYKDCDCFLEYANFKDDSIEHKCLCCNKNYKKSLVKT